jgi:hypothetical protein
MRFIILVSAVYRPIIWRFGMVFTRFWNWNDNSWFPNWWKVAYFENIIIRSKRVWSVDSERCLRTWNGYYRDHMQYHVIFWLRITFPFTTNKDRGCRGRDRIVFGFSTTYTVSVYHHWCCEFESRSERGIQHYVIKFISDLLQVDGFLLSSGFLHE